MKSYSSLDKRLESAVDFPSYIVIRFMSMFNKDALFPG